MSGKKNYSKSINALIEEENRINEKAGKKKAPMLSVKDLVVKFHVRSRILTAIRGISLDIYEGESLAIVGESGSGKSVFTKTFNGMLDDNGFIDQGHIIFRDHEASRVFVKKSKFNNFMISKITARVLKCAKLANGSDTYHKLCDLENEHKTLITFSKAEKKQFDKKLADLQYEKTEKFNYCQTLDPKSDREEIKKLKDEMKKYDLEIENINKEMKNLSKTHLKEFKKDKSAVDAYKTRKKELVSKWKKECQLPFHEELRDVYNQLAKEIYISVQRYGIFTRNKFLFKFSKLLKTSFRDGIDFQDKISCNQFFDKLVFRVKYLTENEDFILGRSVLNLAKINYKKDWERIRGTKIATVFQDPMTSLDPIVTIGKQITSIIVKHQHVSEVEARKRAIELMYKVGIPNAENRFDDYPFQYSGGMRQRIVIAIALSCQPRILLCDEPTTALDVTIQAQILKLIKDLQKEYHYTIVFITHDLGVVANIADRVAVLYGGQIVEIGKVDEVFYEPKHPYTWALLSSLPQLAEKNTELYSISGTPPSLYNEIKGDAFAPRNPYCMKIDTLVEPPMFKVSETHYAKTWLLDPRAPKIKKPKIICNITDKLMKAFNVTSED